MMLTDVIGQSDSESAIYFLLTAYVETLGFHQAMPDDLTKLPLAGVDDVRARHANLSQMIRTLSETVDSETRLGIEESLHVFRSASTRLNCLRGELGLHEGAPRTPALRSPIERSSLLEAAVGPRNTPPHTEAGLAAIGGSAISPGPCDE